LQQGIKKCSNYEDARILRLRLHSIRRAMLKQDEVHAPLKAVAQKVPQLGRLEILLPRQLICPLCRGITKEA
jgi:hypothetical protein